VHRRGKGFPDRPTTRGASDTASVPTELRLDASYRNTNDWKQPEDVFNKFFRFSDGKGINNTSGFRPKSKNGGSTDILSCAFCVLVTTFGETEWPDTLDRQNGIFTYYGDNRSSGRPLADTAVGGNRLLESVFSLLHVGRREDIPPFLSFEKYKTDAGTQMRFLGLACPGGVGLSAFDDLVAVWRVKGDVRFQNYRAVFTVLREEIVSREWLNDLVSGTPSQESPHCPQSWQRWVQSGSYTPLMCARQVSPRSRQQQLPRSDREWNILRHIRETLTDREFEFFAAELVRIMDDRFANLTVTRAVRDGGRDVVGSYRVGHDSHQVLLSVYIEAKQWDPESAVGVKPMMRLLARLKYRDLGVFVTTSYFEAQVQEELIEDQHPVLLVSGVDIVHLLVRAELDDISAGGKLEQWLNLIRQQARG
jgi:hypothetical protein